MTDEFKPVTLVSPDGAEHTASTAEEEVNLRYGHGYTDKTRSKSTTKDEGKS